MSCSFLLWNHQWCCDVANCVETEGLDGTDAADYATWQKVFFVCPRSCVFFLLAKSSGDTWFFPLKQIGAPQLARCSPPTWLEPSDAFVVVVLTSLLPSASWGWRGIDMSRVIVQHEFFVS